MMRKAYSLGLYEKAMPDVSWKEKLQIAKEAGYDFVEISIDATEERISRVYSTKQERRRLVDLCFDLDMPIHTLNASALTKYSLGNPDPAVCARGMEIAERSIELAADLGVRIERNGVLSRISVRLRKLHPAPGFSSDSRPWKTSL